MPIISVIIAAYNAAQYLTEAIQSVLDQTYQDFEVIVVDDGSIDNTREIVHQFNDSRLKYIYQENKGMANARNNGIKVSRGEYITFLDADDIFLPDKFSSQVMFLKQHPNIGLVVGGWIYIDKNGQHLGKYEPWNNFPQLNTSTLLYSCPLIPAAVLIASEWLKRIGLFDENLKGVADWDLWLRLVVAGCRIEWNNQLVCMYRLHEGNTSSQAKLMGTEELQVLDKLYARSDLADEVLAAKDSVYARKYLDRASRLYVAGEFLEAIADVQQAVKLDPQLLTGKPPKAVEIVTNWVYHPIVQDKDQFLTNVQTNFPPITPNLKHHFDRVAAHAWIAKAFEQYTEGNMKMTRAALLRGVFSDPSWLRNRGVWSIGIKAFLGW